MPDDDLQRDGQAQARAARLARARLVDAVEPVEQAGQILLRDADTVVRDADIDIFSALSDMNFDFTAVRRIFYRVGHDVRDHLLDALAVAVDIRQVVRHVHDELTANLAERVTIEELSRKYLMNTTTLKRCFKQVYGETIAAHMKKHRMEQAASLLLKTQNDIAAIAQAVGYESQSRFTAAFKETYGELPTEYRRRRS